jgi:hypothetical protein
MELKEAIPTLNKIINSNVMYKELLNFLDIDQQTQAEKGLFIAEYVEPSSKIVIIDIFNKEIFNEFNNKIGQDLKFSRDGYKEKYFSTEEIHNLRTKIINYFIDKGFKQIIPRDDNKICLLFKL